MVGNCEVCGNQYDKAFEVIAAGAHHVFDSFECAIQALAPHCEHCGCHVVGHGWRPRASSSAARTAPTLPARRRFATASERAGRGSDTERLVAAPERGVTGARVRCRAKR